MIYINGKYLTQRKTGVQRFAFELTKQLISTGVAIEIVIPKKIPIADIGLPEQVLKKVGFFKNSTLWEQIDLVRYLKTKEDPLLISFCNTGPLFFKKHILCIHDMSYYFNPAWFSKSFYVYYKYLIPRLARSAFHLFTVSDFSKKEICEKLKIAKEQVAIVNNAPSAAFIISASSDIVQKKEDFFLFVGSHDPRKNIQLLLKTFSLLEYRCYKLMVVGAHSDSFKTEKFVLSPNIKFVTNCNDTTLSGFYRNAKGLINPSYYEGFGLPLIEAMASGCPLIVSDIPAFKEVAKKNAFYFDPASQSSLKIALNTLLRKPEPELDKIIFNNYTESFKYNWKGSLIQLQKVIQSSI